MSPDPTLHSKRKFAPPPAASVPGTVDSLGKDDHNTKELLPGKIWRGWLRGSLQRSIKKDELLSLKKNGGGRLTTPPAVKKHEQTRGGCSYDMKRFGVLLCGHQKRSVGGSEAYAASKRLHSDTCMYLLWLDYGPMARAQHPKSSSKLRDRRSTVLKIRSLNLRAVRTYTHSTGYRHTNSLENIYSAADRFAKMLAAGCTRRIETQACSVFFVLFVFLTSKARARGSTIARNFQACGRGGCWERAVSLMDDMRREGLAPDELTYR